jgi:hypothetical protein
MGWWYSSSPNSKPQGASISGRKIECRKILQSTPARHLSAFNFSAYPPPSLRLTAALGNPWSLPFSCGGSPRRALCGDTHTSIAHNLYPECLHLPLF